MTKKYGKNSFQKSWKTILNSQGPKTAASSSERMAEQIDLTTAAKSESEKKGEAEKAVSPKEPALGDINAVSFEKKRETEDADPVQPELVPEQTQGPSIFTAGMIIEGDIQCKGNLEVHGQILGNVFCDGRVFVDGEIRGGIQAHSVSLKHAVIQGDILCEKDLEVLEQSVITGNLQGEHITLNSKIKGNLYCKGILALMESSLVEGDITTGRILVQEGARITGSIITNEAENEQGHADSK